MAQPVIEVRGVVNRFGRQVVHDGLDLEVRAGEVFSIVGGSGSGKSVLLRTMLGLQEPAAGSVRIEGRPGGPLGTPGATNMLRIAYVGNEGAAGN